MAAAKSQQETQEELNLDVKVTIRNYSNRNLGFPRKDGIGDIQIPPFGAIRLSRSEIILQAQSSNAFICGTDGAGTHAPIYIEDAPTREELLYDDGDKKQKCYATFDLEKTFALKSQTAFENAIKDAIYTKYEKESLMHDLQKMDVNKFDYKKVRFVERHTGKEL